MSRDTDLPSLLRRIPPVDRLLAAEALAPLLARSRREAVVAALRRVLEDLRERAREGGLAAADLAPEVIARQVGEELERRSRPYYRRVVNATGVVLHTNLGRAPLAPEAIEALTAGAGAQRLEIDLASGERGGRDAGCAELLQRLTGCEAATVVNNNAAATLLLLAALARGRKVLLSRGEMVEIGGSYRIPEVMLESGAQLAEVGTTNRTHLADYERALDDETALILKVHTSNYRIEGFTCEVPIEDLAALGRRRGVPVVHDLGSGSLVHLGRRGLPHEPYVHDSVAAGAELVCFSGDKLLGGPQAGVLLGRAEAVARCRRHPLFRALRPGRLVYTALEATLRLYLDGEEGAVERVPALTRLTADPEMLRRRAQRLARRLRRLAPGDPALEVEVVRCASQAGSGSLPARELPSWGVRVRSADLSAGDLAAALRRGEPPVLGRVADDALLLDVRTLDDGELPQVAAAFGRLRGTAETS